MTMEAVEEKGLQRVGGMGLAAFEPRDFGELERLARYCKASGLFKVASFEAALVVMLTGASLGLPVVAALRGIHVIEGKSVLSSDLLVAVVLKSGQCLRWTPVEVSDKRCIIETHRRGSADPVRHEWTAAMAAAAGLTSKATWRQYPAAMLRARCSAELARIVYPDVMFGVYAEGEIEAEGELVSVTRIDSGHPSATPEIDGAPEPDDLTPPTCADLAGLATWYAALGLAADDSVRADEAVGLATDHLIALGYLLSGAEIHRALSGLLPGVLCHVHDVLAAESTAEGVARAYGAVRAMVAGCEDGDLRAECKVAAARYYGGRHTPPLKGKAAQTALAAALAPKPTPPDGGGERPTAPQPMADVHGATAAASNDSAAAVARETRVELEPDERELRLVTDATAWAQHLADADGYFAVAVGFKKRRAAFRLAGVYEARRAATVAEIARRYTGDEGAASGFLDRMCDGARTTATPKTAVA